MLEWHPTVLHDLHEAQSYLYVSTGHRPVQPVARPDRRSTNGGCSAQTEVMEMAKRGVPGVFTYGFYDGWVPNYLFWIAITHNSFGRFYEVQSYGPDVKPNLQLGADADQPRVVPPESAAALHQVGTAQQHQHPGIGAAAGDQQGGEGARAVPRELLAEEQARDREGQERSDLRLGDSRRAAPQGRCRRHGERPAPPGSRGPQGRRRVQGRQRRCRGRRLHRSARDQPYRTLVDMYFSVQNYPPANPRPYDDTGWTMQYMRNVKLNAIDRQSDARSGR